MDAALKVNVKGSGPRLVVFLTDGSPTVGETDPKKIAEMVMKSNAGEHRVFVFGVGETVNAVLLDKMAADNGGFAEYMKPDAEVETALVAFYDKIAYPVLSNAVLEIPGVKTTDKFPRSMGDLYRGQQIVLFGRYKEKGASVISLKGLVEGKEKKFEFEGEFPNESLENDFIPRLWANRKVGYLLEEIRINGESTELREEVVRLGKEFGIVTPYTSYLVVEDENSRVAPAPCCVTTPRPTVALPPPPPSPSPVIDGLSMSRGGTFGEGTGLGSGSGRSSEAGGVSGGVPGGVLGGKAGGASAPAPKNAPAKPAEPKKRADYGASTGDSAIEASKDMRRRKESSTLDGEQSYQRTVEGRSYRWDGARWSDESFTSSMKTLEIAPMSEAYFALLKLRPDLAKAVALGEVVILVAKGKAVVITASGKSKIDEKDLSAFCK
jgi:Ca-activated chloride channel family protein